MKNLNGLQKQKQKQKIIHTLPQNLRDPSQLSKIKPRREREKKAYTRANDEEMKNFILHSDYKRNVRN